ncbi:MAG: hypothetical protein ACOYL3_22345, partial [Desulfuromonadaceae bacterium]
GSTKRRWVGQHITGGGTLRAMRQAVEVINEMKVAPGACVNYRLFQFVFRAGSVCCTQFTSAKIVLAVLFTSCNYTFLFGVCFQRHI